MVSRCNVKRITLICLTMIVAASSGKARAQADGTPEGAATKPVSVTFRRESVTPLSALLSVALQYDVPLGLILGKEPTLCRSLRDFDIRDSGIRESLDSVVQGTGYVVSSENGVFDVIAPDLTAHEKYLLNHRFQWFAASRTTMAGVGQTLGGYLATADGATGFATDTISNPSGEYMEVSRIYNVTTTEIANRIVLAGSKGVWVFHPTPTPRQTSDIQSPIDIYGYANDAYQLPGITCGTKTP